MATTALQLFLVLPNIFQIQGHVRSSTTPTSFNHLRKHCSHIPPIPSTELISRQLNLVKTLHQTGLSALIAEPGPTAQYYLNVSSSLWRKSERPLLVGIVPGDEDEDRDWVKPKVLVLTPKFEAARARELLKIPSLTGEVSFIEWAEEEDPYRVFYQAISTFQHRGPSSSPSSRVAVDGQTRLFVAQGLQRAGFDLARDDHEYGAVGRIRERKSANEVEILKCVNEATLLAVRDVRERLFFGMTEIEAAQLMTRALVQAGLGEQGSFATVQFGENAGVPHKDQTDKPLRTDELVTFDVGGTLHGYWSDLTRTFALPESAVPTRNLEIWYVVQAAQEAALRTAREGARADEVDEAARRIIRYAGHGESFTHRLGHGVGLEVHESPYIRGGNEIELESGNTFSNEPGIYISGELGVRLEDCIVIDGLSGRAILLTEEVGGSARSPWMP